MKRPCAALFLQPVDKNEEGMSSYYDRIRNPMDLGQVQAKLLMNEYSDSDDWMNDIKMIWQNAERFYGRDAFATSLAHQLRKTFMKMVKTITNETGLKDWASALKESSEQLADLVTHAPPAVACSNPTYVRVPVIQKMSPKSIQRLIDTVAELTDRSDARAMAALVMQYEPRVQFLSKNVQLDAEVLTPVTTAALERYVRQRFQELGKTFPS